MPEMNLTPVIFSGHNERAVITLCRYFSEIGRSFFLVSYNEDVIYNTLWSQNVIIKRKSLELNLDLFKEVSHSLSVGNAIPVYCPTSEFLNHFILQHKKKIKSFGWKWTFPDNRVYVSLTNKSTSSSVIKKIIGLSEPLRINRNTLKAPCVLKPRKNVVKEKVFYPLICKNASDLRNALRKIEWSSWFAQDWIEGQSIYLCAYLDRDGDWSAYWQENLLQQPNGKSIVLARPTNNPGIDITVLMQGLHNYGYHGPFMMEIIRDEKNRLFFIEINPRFWGPLELGRKAFPNFLNRFIMDIEGKSMGPSVEYVAEKVDWYSWAYGAKLENLHVYPSLKQLTLSISLEEFLQINDVYNSPDTIDLSNTH